MNSNISETKIKLDTHDTHSKNLTIINNLTSEKAGTHVARTQTHRLLSDTHITRTSCTPRSLGALSDSILSFDSYIFIQSTTGRSTWLLKQKLTKCSSTQ